MLSLKERLDLLEQHLKVSPPQISVHSDLPFAILRYDPTEQKEKEWEVRRQVKLLATKLTNYGWSVQFISLADLLWQAIAETEGIEIITELESDRDFEAAQEQVTTYLSDLDWLPLPQLLARRMASLQPDKHIVFLMRASVMAPAIYHMSKLLEEMQGKTKVTTVLFYPGKLEGTTGLRFMGLKDREALGNYRVKIYG